MSNLKRPLAALAGFCLAVAGSFSSAHAATQTLRVSAIPDEAPTELQRKFEPLGKYLQQELNMPVTFRPVADYAGVVAALGAGQLDLAWPGGFLFVQARLATVTAIQLVQPAQNRTSAW